MAYQGPGDIARELAKHGYNADRAVIQRLLDTEDPDAAVRTVLEKAPNDAVLDDETVGTLLADSTLDSGAIVAAVQGTPPETEGGQQPDGRRTERSPQRAEIAGDVTGESTCTGEYDDFVKLFRDRFERLAGPLRRRVDHRPTDALETVPGGTQVGVVGVINDIRTTSGGHRLIEVEDTNGTAACLATSDRALPVDTLLLDEVIAVEGTMADDGGVIFVDGIRFPDVPRRYTPSTATRAVSAALISDIHVGSNEFVDEAWSRFAEWLHSPAADHVEYLLIAGDMVEGVGVYPDQDQDLAIVDIYDQYRAFAERLGEVPADMEVIMIPGNHDAVRLAEPQPAFDDELREILGVKGARIAGNPATVSIEGVSILLYHGVSLDEIIARIPDANYDHPAAAMTHLLRKRHLAPTYGSRTQIAPEHRDYLVIDEVPDVFHAGHVHTIGVDSYHGVTVLNSGCWQAQTAFQRRNNIDPDYGYAPILDLVSLEVTFRKFR